MKRFYRILLLTCVFLVFSAAANAQSRGENSSSVVSAVAKGAGKAAVVVVGSATKGTWTVTKFGANNFVKPVAKFVFLEMAPSAGKFLVRSSAKRLVPVAVKLSVL